MSGYPLAVITGAAHRLGRAIAIGLAQQGFAIGLHYHASFDAARETADELAQITNAPVHLLQADLMQPDEIDHMFARVATFSNRLNVLVNSAAVMSPGNLMEMRVEEWEAVLNLNLRAPWLCACAAARLMDPEGGVIVNISDSSAQKTWAGYQAYILSKSALETLTRLLAKDLAPNVRVNAVAPGLILPAPGFPTETWDRLVQRLPLQTVGQPEDVVRAILFFIQNPYVTGQVLAVDGGYQII